MNKSVTLLFLMSSLVMLAAPFTNLNFFSNTAMAQGYDTGYGDSSYSKYPTEDNKYECRTGPLEGFFVSSVEFCKHVKFDDKDRKDIRDNRTGTQGPAGISTINGSNYYSVFGNLSTIGNDGTANSTVSCNVGDVALSGEYRLFNANATSPTVFQFQSIDPDPPSNWITQIIGFPFQGVITVVNCFDNSP